METFRELEKSLKDNHYYECFVNKESKLPFLAMPDAIRAINLLMGANANKIKSEMEDLLSTFLIQNNPAEVDVSETLREGSSPLMVVIKMPILLLLM